MLTRLQNGLRLIGRQIHGSKSSWGIRLNSEERTQRTWAKVIDSYESIPEIYKDFFRPGFSEGQPFPYIVLTPSFETLGYRINEKLVCAFDREIQILERNRKELVVQCYPLEGISYVEVSSMLLDSRIRINGMARDGNLTSSIVRFSTATDYVLAPVLKRIRLYKVESKEAVQKRELEKFDPWLGLNFKFMNFARNSLLGGEKVLCTILQPEVNKGIFTFLGRTYYRTISPTHACILTDRELILIREEALEKRHDKYGGIWDYIPVSKIASLSMDRKNGNLLVLTIHLDRNECFKCLFQASMENEVDQLIARFTEVNSL